MEHWLHWGMGHWDIAGIGALAHLGIGALAHWRIGALGHWGIGALGHWGIGAWLRPEGSARIGLGPGLGLGLGLGSGLELRLVGLDAYGSTSSFPVNLSTPSFQRMSKCVVAPRSSVRRQPANISVRLRRLTR